MPMKIVRFLDKGKKWAVKKGTREKKSSNIAHGDSNLSFNERTINF